MNNKFIPVISFFMTISLIVFVGMQFYWLKGYYSALEQDFSNKVHEVLESTSEKVNSLEVKKYYSKYKDFDKSVIANGNNPTLTITQSVEDDKSKRQITTYKSIISSNDIPISQDGDSIKVTKMYTDESLVEINRNENTPEELTAELDQEIESGEFNTKEFAKINAQNLPIEERVDSHVLDSILNNELRLKGISEDFGYGVIDLENKETIVHDSIFDKHQNKTAYTYPLFTDREDKTLYKLSVVFPKKGFAIAKNNLPMLVGTLVSMLIILIIYVFSISYMMRQKKIADVKTDFINNMSHEFKTPIATISVASDSLSSDRIATNPDKVRQYSKLIKNENLRMKKQVETVLNMSKLERNEVKLFYKTADVHILIEKIAQSFEIVIEQRQGKLIKDYSAQSSKFKVDEFHFSNVISNLLDNANKYSPESPFVKISTKNEGNYFVVKISDQGMGMDLQKNKSKIFEKFYREETGNVHNVKGQGLGLSYVKKIIDLFQGHIDVTSKRGKGSVFTVKIPMKK